MLAADQSVRERTAGFSRLRRKFAREVSQLDLPAGPCGDVAIGSDLVDGLPEPAQRYLRFMRVVGREPDWSFRVGYTGRFRTGPHESWRPCEVWQYNHRAAVARIFYIEIRFGGILPVVARDTYIDGRGRMLVRLLDRCTVDDGTGEEFDIGELATYLNDAVLLAPSMLFVPEVAWSAVDSGSFDVALTDHGRTVSARVTVDASGAPSSFSTTDRFCYDPKAKDKLTRARWSTPVEKWEMVEGRPLPASARAMWHLPRESFAYADFRPIPGSLAFNVAAGE